MDEFLENGGPFVCFHPGHLVHALEDFFFIDGVVPAFFFGAGYLVVISNLVSTIRTKGEILHRGS